MRWYFVFDLWDKPNPAFRLAAILANKCNKQAVLKKHFIKWKTDVCRWGWTFSVLRTAALQAQKFLIPPPVTRFPPAHRPPPQKDMFILTEDFSLQSGSSSKAAVSTEHRKAKRCIFAERQVSSGTHPIRSLLHLLRLCPLSSFLLLLVLFQTRISPRTFFF